MSHFTALNKKGCLQRIQIFFWIWPNSNLLRKTNFISITLLLSEIVTFWLKRDFFSEFPRKCFKTTGKHSLPVYGSFLGEKQFLLLFIPFYWFDQKKLFKQIQIFLRICHLSNLLRKTNFVSIFVLLSEIVIFGLKREFFNELARKCFKPTENHNLAVFGSFCWEKSFLFIFVPFYCFGQKGLFTTNPNFPLDLQLFNLVEK